MSRLFHQATCRESAAMQRSCIASALPFFATLALRHLVQARRVTAGARDASGPDRHDRGAERRRDDLADGQISAQEEVNLAFRITGRMIERNVNVGDRITRRPGRRAARVGHRAATRMPAARADLAGFEAGSRTRGSTSIASSGCSSSASRRGPCSSARRRRATPRRRTWPRRKLSSTPRASSSPSPTWSPTRRDRDRARRRAGRGGAGRADDPAGRARGRARRRVRRSGAA